MINTPHPPGHHDAMQVAEKAGSRAAGQAFFGKCLDATGMENARRHAMCSAYLAHMRPQIEREVMQALLDPMVVHRNMLAGTIAKLNVNDVRHLYPEIERAAAEAMREACVNAAKRHVSKFLINGPLWHEGQDWSCDRIAEAIRALPLPAPPAASDAEGGA